MMARASSVLPAPRSPCSATTSPIESRRASAPPSRWVAARSGNAKVMIAGEGPDTPADVTRVRCGSVAVVIGLERSVFRHTDVLRLVGAQLGQRHADLLEVQRRDLL